VKAPLAIITALVVGTVVLGLTQTAGYLWDEPMATFTRDFQVTAGVPWYTGAISVLNNMVWTGIALLSCFVAWLQPARRGRLLAFGGVHLRARRGRRLAAP